MLSKKTSMVTMVTDEFLENRIVLQKSVATIGFIWFFWFQKCILLYIFVQVFLVMRSIRSHISLFRLGFTPTLTSWLQRDCIRTITSGGKRAEEGHNMAITHNQNSDDNKFIFMVISLLLKHQQRSPTIF